MTLVLIIFLAAPLALGALMYASGNRSWLALITVPLAFYTLPVLVVAGFYIFRAPIQQGRILAQLGPVLSMVFPPDDLYIPLALTELSDGVTEYTLSFTHRYVGHHALEISVPGKASMEKMEPELKIGLQVYDGQTLLLSDGPKSGSGFWGKNDHGLHFTWYDVPRDLPVAVPLKARITVVGDVGGFLEGRQGTTIRITKVSDE